MKALVKSQADIGLWQEDRPVPDIGPEDVLIKVNKTGICGTDIHIWNWDTWAARTVPLGLITGHEFAGEIVELGAQVQGLALGQRCSGEGHLIGKSSRQSRAATPANSTDIPTKAQRQPKLSVINPPIHCPAVMPSMVPRPTRARVSWRCA